LKLHCSNDVASPQELRIQSNEGSLFSSFSCFGSRATGLLFPAVALPSALSGNPNGALILQWRSITGCGGGAFLQPPEVYTRRRSVGWLQGLPNAAQRSFPYLIPSILGLFNFLQGCTQRSLPIFIWAGCSRHLHN